MRIPELCRLLFHLASRAAVCNDGHPVSSKSDPLAAVFLVKLAPVAHGDIPLLLAAIILPARPIGQRKRHSGFRYTNCIDHLSALRHNQYVPFANLRGGNPLAVQDDSSPPHSPGGRWVPYDYQNWYHLIRDGVGCLWCGRAGSGNADQMHSAAACLACGTMQCNSKPECAACFYGWMPGWSRGLYVDTSSRQCGYANCTNAAVAKAPRVGRVCKAHLGRPKVNGRPLADVIEENRRRSIEHEGGQRWQWQWMTWREPATPAPPAEQAKEVTASSTASSNTSGSDR